jgi:hypothetical protein
MPQQLAKPKKKTVVQVKHLAVHILTPWENTISEEIQEVQRLVLTTWGTGDFLVWRKPRDYK